MKLSIAPVFPVWLIVILVVIAIGLRVAMLFTSLRRRGRQPDGRMWLRFGAGVLAILCLGLAATRIGDESRAEQPPRLTTTAEEDNINVFFVIDRSMGMTARDFEGNEERLTGAQQDLQVMLRKYQNSRFSVISYADTARVEWPLSPDVWSLVPFLWNFTPYGGDDATSEGQIKTIVSASDSVLKEELDKAVREYPGSANLVYILGSASDEGDWAFDIPRGQVSGGAVYGYGTERGGYVYMRPNGATSSEDVRSALNEPALRTAADSLDIPYVHREQGTIAEDSLAETAPQAVPVDPIVPDVPHPNRIEYYWLFAAIGAALFGVELYGLARHWLRRRGGGPTK
jgi:von Willebrand factor type A domain